MNIPTWVWALTFVVLIGIIIADLFIITRRPHHPSVSESAMWSVFYILGAGLFGLGIYFTSGGTYAGEFYAGFITEKSLSVDNLFVFLIIMSRFAVPREFQQKVLMIGIILALVLRGGFIAGGAALVSRFSWVFYLFGAVLLYTAVHLAMHGNDDEDDFKENAVLRWSRRHLRVSDDYDGARLTTRMAGHRLATPMLIVMIAIGTTDVLFALDSIPAIFGLTQEPYLVFTANVFALMGLRQLYFLLHGLLDRLVYLSYGLSVILGFIGVKLVLHALHENNMPFLNGGEEIHSVPEISIGASLSVIGLTLLVATVASLWKVRRDRRAVVAEAGTGDDPDDAVLAHGRTPGTPRE